MSDKTLKAPWTGELKIGEVTIPCYVLEDGRRMLSLRGVTKALGMSWSGGKRLTQFIGTAARKALPGKDLTAVSKKPTAFTPPHGGRTVLGTEAAILPEICEIILAAHDAGLLHRQQLHIAERAKILFRGFGIVGIIALVDEATGYQDIRVKDALEKILSKYLLQEKKPYIGMFPLWFYREIYRLNDWHWTPENAQKRPGVIGRWTNELIYGKMAPGLLEEIQKRNPTVTPGRRAFKNFQLLTDEIGDPALRAHFDGLGALMRASTQWRKFRALVEKAYPDPNKTLELELGYHEKE